MPPRKKVAGYDENGNPLEEMLPSPMEMQDEPLPPIEQLPDDGTQIPYDQLQSMNGVNDSMDQLISGGMSPEEAAKAIQDLGGEVPSGYEMQPDEGYRQDAPSDEPQLKATGAQMDLGFIEALNNAPDDETFNSMVQQLDPVQKHIYDRAFGYKQITPAWAAQQAESFYRMRDEAAKAQQSPEAKLAQEQSIASTQAAYESADKIVTIMDRLRGFRKDEEGADKKVPKYYGRVGPVDSAFPAMMNADRNAWFVDFQALKDQLALAARGGIKGTGPISDFEQKMLSNAAMGGLDYGRDDASFGQVFEETYDIANKKREEHRKKLSALTGETNQAAATATPAAARRQTKTIGNQTWVRTPEGWVPQQ